MSSRKYGCGHTTFLSSRKYGYNINPASKFWLQHQSKIYHTMLFLILSLSVFVTGMLEGGSTSKLPNGHPLPPTDSSASAIAPDGSAIAAELEDAPALRFLSPRREKRAGVLSGFSPLGKSEQGGLGKSEQGKASFWEYVSSFLSSTPNDPGFLEKPNGSEVFRGDLPRDLGVSMVTTEDFSPRYRPVAPTYAIPAQQEEAPSSAGAASPSYGIHRAYFVAKTRAHSGGANSFTQVSSGEEVVGHHVIQQKVGQAFRWHDVPLYRNGTFGLPNHPAYQKESSPDLSFLQNVLGLGLKRGKGETTEDCSFEERPGTKIKFFFHFFKRCPRCLWS